jgi:nucleoside-diphosphate-sugar epimerase
MSIFIFGAGPIGLSLKDYYAKKGFRVYVFSNTQTPNPEFKSSMEKLMRYGEVKTLDTPDVMDSCIITTRIELLDKFAQQKLLEDMKLLNQNNVKILNLSSVSVYGSSSSYVSEINTPSPINEYGLEKLKAEEILNVALKSGSFINLRVSNLFGLQVFHDLTNIAISKLRKHEVILLPKKRCYRDFVFINDLFDFIFLWSSDGVRIAGDLNFSSGH